MVRAFPGSHKQHTLHCTCRNAMSSMAQLQPCLQSNQQLQPPLLSLPEELSALWLTCSMHSSQHQALYTVHLQKLPLQTLQPAHQLPLSTLHPTSGCACPTAHAVHSVNIMLSLHCNHYPLFRATRPRQKAHAQVTRPQAQATRPLLTTAQMRHHQDPTWQVKQPHRTQLVHQQVPCRHNREHMQSKGSQ